jgi:anion-transporting  ArsA/GET3 family ATPase
MQFFAASRLVIVAGKGGVGKTTVTAALATAAGGLGLRTLVVEVEGKSGLGQMLGAGRELGYDEIELATGLGPSGTGQIRARTLTPDLALYEYLDEHGLRRLGSRLVRGGMLDVVATAAPGIDDILVLGKVKQLERGGSADVIILDAPAAGHAITFLQSARGLLDAVAVGPINTQATDVLEMLSDPKRTQVVLVTLAEETPVNELVETAFALEDRVGLSLGLVVANAIYPTLDGIDVPPADAATRAGVRLGAEELATLTRAAEFRRDRTELQREQLARLTERLPLPQIRLPFVFRGGLGVTEVEQLAAALADGLTALAA